MLKRDAEEVIMNINKTFKVLLVTGPRQVGKTTLLKSLMPKDMTYISLDDLTLREQAKINPKGFLEENPGKLFIDEVQYAPELFPYIKLLVDESNDMGQFWLSGSQKFHLMKGVSESLAGRVGIVNLNSFTYSELIQNDRKILFTPDNYKKSDYINVNDLFEAIFNGGMPHFNVMKDINRDIFFESYINTYIERDVRSLTQVGDELAFRNFLISVASRTGEQLNYSSISKEVGITDVTVKKWLSILITSGLVYLLEPYKSTKLKRVTHMPKIIFMDTGLCSYLAGWDDARSLQTSSSAGHYLETYIVSELIKSYDSKGVKLNISYYRDKDKNEIDLIITKNNVLYPYEIKKTSTPTISMLKNFDKLSNIDKEIGIGGIICCYDKLLRLNEDNYVIPISSVINASE